MKRLRKGQGIALSTWLGCIEETDRKFKIWCDFYNCDMTPSEAVEIVKRG